MIGWLIAQGRVLGLLTERGPVRATFAPDLPPPPVFSGNAQRTLARPAPPPPRDRSGGNQRGPLAEEASNEPRRVKDLAPTTNPDAPAGIHPAPERGQLGLPF